MVRAVVFSVAAVVFVTSEVVAQAPSSDSTFRTGSCSPQAANLVKWDSVVTEPEVPARPTRESVLRFPEALRGPNGAYVGRAVVAMVTDYTGHVVAGSVSIVESSDPQLSAWLCTAAGNLRFEPARVGGKPVLALTEQPYSYIMPPRRSAPK